MPNGFWSRIEFGEELQRFGYPDVIGTVFLLFDNDRLLLERSTLFVFAVVHHGLGALFEQSALADNGGWARLRINSVRSPFESSGFGIFAPIATDLGQSLQRAAHARIIRI
jgi:hypothetical protein